MGKDQNASTKRPKGHFRRHSARPAPGPRGNDAVRHALAPTPRARRPRNTGPVTFAWVHPVVLTQLCSQNCAYCPYPNIEASPVPSIARVREHANLARKLGVLHLRLSSGEGIEPHAVLQSTLHYYGFASLADYLRAILGEFTRNSVVPPLLPELDMGALPFTMMQQLRPHILAMRLFLDSMDERVRIGPAHGGSPMKSPRRRIEALLNAARTGIPVNSGTMIGIGESLASRIKALQTLAEISRRHRHIQSVTLQPFVPAEATEMHDVSPPSPEEMIEAVALARRILPPEVVVACPASLYPGHLADFMEAGADDLGDFELTGETAHDAGVKASFVSTRKLLAALGRPLHDRLAIHPRFANPKWVAPKYAALLSELNAKRE